MESEGNNSIRDKVIRTALGAVALGTLITGCDKNTAQAMEKDRVGGATTTEPVDEKTLATMTTTKVEIPSAIPTETVTIELKPTATPEATPTLMPTPTIDLAEVAIPEKGFIEKMNVEKPIFALTIDDGYSKEGMEEILTVLEQNNVRATFFIIGNAAKYDLGPELLKRAVEDGDEIGYHSVNHDQEAIKTWTEADWENDYLQWTQMMKDLLGDDLYAKGVKKYARAPGGLFDQAFLAMTKKYSLIPVGWDADAPYWNGGVKPKKGDIFLMHVDTSNVADLEKYIKLTNISPVTMSEMVQASLDSSRQ